MHISRHCQLALSHYESCHLCGEQIIATVLSVCLCQEYNLPIWMVLCMLKPFVLKCHLEADYTQNSFQVNDHIYRTCACTTYVITLHNQSENLGKKKGWMSIHCIRIQLCVSFLTKILQVLWHLWHSDFLRPSSLYKENMRKKWVVCQYGFKCLILATLQSLKINR